MDNSNIKKDCYYFNQDNDSCNCCKDLNCRACKFYKSIHDKKSLKPTVEFLNWYNNRYYTNSHTPKDK